MMTGKIRSAARLTTALYLLFLTAFLVPLTVEAASESEAALTGGGYAVTGQLKNVGYDAKIYDAANGLPTSDAMFVMGDSRGYVWIGGYSGVLRYDGSVFRKYDTSTGLTSARGIFEDSKGRIWVGTNDNGVVVIDGEETTHITYKDGLPSSSIRVFAEDAEENVFIGTTAGVAYADAEGMIKVIDDERINDKRISRLDSDSNGRIYGKASDGIVFAIDGCRVTEAYNGEALGMAKITSVLADPVNTGKVYLTTEDGNVYYGSFGDKADKMKKISVSPLGSIHWISYDCERVWVSSTTEIGFIDTDGRFQLLEGLPMNSAIEMMTSDYQGNMWVASSTQGVMKLVANNFVDLNKAYMLSESVTNTVCLYEDRLYIGTDSGLNVLDSEGNATADELSGYIGDNRIRCIYADTKGSLWVCTFTGHKGLICRTADGSITSYTVESGMPSDEVRCVCEMPDGSIAAGTNGGAAFIRDGKVERTVGSDEGIKNTVLLTLACDENGKIYAGSDGDGIYIIDGNIVSHIGRDDGLTSDVVMRIKKDDKNGVYWIVTSNSIEYLKDGKITNVSSFPYNNNYDLYFSDNGEMWILSSYGIYRVRVDDMLADSVGDYLLYTITNGLPYSINTNSYSTLDTDGDLYIAGRKGVIRVNIADYFDGNAQIKTALDSLYCGDERILPNEYGTYTIPASQGRVRITPSVMDYTNSDPLVRVYLDGSGDEGVTAKRSRLSALEYTSLPYGNYKLHIQILDNSGRNVLSDDVYEITKMPRILELFFVKVLIAVLVILLTGFAVWRVLRSTVIKKQYEAISRARDEAERANTAKSRFLANMSHEIRTPINTIMGMNEMAMREDAEGVPKKYFMSMMNYAFDIRNASETLLGLINDVLDMSKIESGKMHLVEQEYDTQEMIRSIVSMIRVRSTQKELTFDVIVDEILPKHLYGDNGKIKQIVLNLLTNAVKYTSMGGIALTVSVNGRNGNICELAFSVKDTGMGVKKEDIGKLFTAYERLDEEKNSGIQGTGLGLDISRRFAELMEGDLTCESVYGEGSEFILTVRQRITDETPIGVFMEHDEKAARGAYVPQFVAPDANVLVVDDNPMNLNVIKGLLKPTKVFVTTAASGEECLDLIESTTFDVVLLDHLMPGMDGIETVTKIRENHPDLPVYALTANSASDEGFYLSKGFNGYLSKPVDSVVLEKAIMKHLPEAIMEKPAEEAAVEEITEIPAEMSWIYETEGISVEDGIKNSAGVQGYIFALKLFYDTIESNAKVIKDAYDNGDIRLYTIKVHALKSSARIIGAHELSSLAEKLENAGNHEDIGFIDENTGDLIEIYTSFRDKLSGLEEKEDDSEKEPISDEDLIEACEMLEGAIPQRDYDLVEIVMDKLKEYKLPDDLTKKFAEFGRLVDAIDWGGMEAFIDRLRPEGTEEQ